MTGNPSNRSPDKTARRALRTSQERYRLVVKLIRVVNSTLDLQTVFRHASRGVRALYRCDRASLLLSGGAGFAADYATGTCKEHTEPPLSEGLSAWLAGHRRCRTVWLEEDRQFPEDDSLFKQGFKAAVQQPLISRERIVGLLALASRDVERG